MTTYKKPITIERLNQATGEWAAYATAHADVNKSGGSEYLSSGSDQAKTEKTFEVRYSSQIAAIELETQLFRILYAGHYYDVTDYDLFKDDITKSVRLLGVATR